MSGGGAWAEVVPFLEPLVNSLECGVLVVDERRRIVVASHPLAALFGMPTERIVEMSPAAFVQHTCKLVDDPPDRLRLGRMFPDDTPDSSIICEEFELTRPARSVVRWVARRLTKPVPLQVAVVTDITAEVDLTAAYERLAVTDRLTGLSNRRGAEAVLKREMLRARRYGLSLSVVLFDVDHFKRINDTHGHSVGDHVLRQVARGIAGQVRETDLAARWGGEEFIVLLANTGLESAHICAERIRRTVSMMSTPTGEPVTISGGAVQMQSGETITDLLGRADELLYRAKREGRNRVA
jgi:diguanylate cyclase (GGDEF)-like protein